MKAVDFALSIARDAADARRVLAAGGDGAKFMAGGQSLGPMLNLRLARPTMIVEISRAADLRHVTDAGDALIYGAAITHAAIEDGEAPDATPGWMARIAGGIAYRAVRNRGTIGGSLAHADPAADWIVTLAALGAEAIVAGSAGERRIAMPGFMTAPFTTALAAGEVLTGVRVPKRGPAARFGYWKFARKPGEFAKASAAVLLDDSREPPRIAVGALEAPPVLLPDPARVLADPAAALDALAALFPRRNRETLELHAEAIRRAVAEVQAR